VEFFRNGIKLGEDAVAPYSFAWNGVTAGSYSLTAVATDNTSNTTTSAAINITVNSPNAPTTNTLIALSSRWRYLDNGTDQGTAWTSLAFDDSSWSNGLAQLGYGDGDEATVVNGGPANNHFVTTYFRRAFVVDDPVRVQGLILDLLRDDGAVLYINGQEIFRTNMPAGPITYTTYAGPVAGECFVCAFGRNEHAGCGNPSSDAE
jgi:hypothetical protein